MNLIHEYGLLITVALPVAVVLAMNAWLALKGERDTLLLPAPRAYPSLPVDAEGSAPAKAVPTPEAAPQPRLEPLRHAA